MQGVFLFLSLRYRISIGFDASVAARARNVKGGNALLPCHLHVGRGHADVKEHGVASVASSRVLDFIGVFMVGAA
jgi:hypothetical protein